MTKNRMRKRLAALLPAAALLLFTACGNNGGQGDAETLLREARANATSMTSCTATYTGTLNITVNGEAKTLQTASNLTYISSPFSLKSSQSSQLAGETDNTLSYTITESDGVWFYSKTGDNWQKVRSEGIGTTPLEQVDILRLLPGVTGQKYVRATTLNGQRVHKVELTFQSSVISGMIESISAASGLGDGSDSFVSALLEGAGDVYGYGYISEDGGQLIRLELDATESLNRMFQNIDGAAVSVGVSKATVSGDISNANRAEPVTLPEEAKNASTGDAVG